MKQKMEKKPKTDWAALRNLSETELRGRIAADPDYQGIDAKMWDKARLGMRFRINANLDGQEQRM